MSRSALFWDITQRIVLILYRHFGTLYFVDPAHEVNPYSLRMTLLRAQSCRIVTV
jgi:hypothetical protein